MGSKLIRAALVSFSGGQDSTTTLAWALSRYDRVETVGFSYGQKHVVEIDCRADVRDRITAINPAWKTRLGPDHLVTLDLIGQLSGLNIETYDETETRVTEVLGVGKRYIPGRNMIMLSMCGSVAFRRGLRTIVYGASETEYSGYPDCQRHSISAINSALNASTGLNFEIEVPLMPLDKAGVWRLAHDLGGEKLVSLIVEHTHTCYTGVRSSRSDWGFGCGNCAACRLREKGWNEFKSANAFH